MKSLNNRQVVSLIKAVGQQRTVLVEGESGIGKTSIHYALAQEPAFMHYHAPKPIDCTQLSDGALWMPDIDRSRGVSRELPNERFGVNEENHGGIAGSRPVLLAFDEIAKARQYVKDMVAPVINERRLGNHALPAGSIVMCFTNLSDEGLGDTMLAHLRNRLVIVRMRKPTKDEWVGEFAIPRNIHETVISAVEMYPLVFDSFLDYRTGGKNAGRSMAKDNPYIHNPGQMGDEQFVTPRSLHIASDVINGMDKMDTTTLECALEGAVGRPFAMNVMNMVRFGQQVPSFEHVVQDPAGCPLPDNPSAQIVQVFQFIKQVQNTDHANAACEYVLRMKGEMQALFTLRIADSTRIEKFALSPVFATMMAKNRALITQ